MENKPYGVVYMIVNLVNGKRYVGQTIQDPKVRYRDHINGVKGNWNSLIHRAIKKYGKENFIFGVIEECQNREELNDLEEKMIEFYNSHVDSHGYNIEKKYMGSKIVSESTKEKMRKSSNKPERIEEVSKLGKSNRGKKIRKNSRSIYVGVQIINSNFVAICKNNSKSIYLGCFISEAEAAKAYDVAAIEYYGQSTPLNFPELREEYLNKKITPIKKIFKKSNSDIKGVSYFAKRNVWIFSRLGFKVKQFKNKDDAEKYAKECLGIIDN